MQIESGDSWFSAKSIEVLRLEGSPSGKVPF